MDSGFSSLARLTQVIGAEFGTDPLCFMLYSLIRMQRPARVVELGTGFGLSSFWMAQAVRENGFGHVWTVDDFVLLRGRDLSVKLALIEAAGFHNLPADDPERYFLAMRSNLGLDGQLTQVSRTIDLADPGHFEHYPFADEKIDFLFSDFQADPLSIIHLLGQLLPRLSATSSVFIDSASTWWPSYLLLENLVGQLNAGHLPAVFSGLGYELAQSVKDRRFTLVHLTRPASETQNGTAWIKIQPFDLFPHPRTRMHF